MHFCLLDRVLHHAPGRIVTLKTVTGAEEYLQDHVPTFPVLPGVLMLEAMVQAARRLIELDAKVARLPLPPRHVLGSVRALKYGAFVAPGMVLRVEIVAHEGPNAALERQFKASGALVDPATQHADTAELPTCVSGRIMLRPVRLGGAPGGAGGLNRA
jgi:3-hydroxyacyl-[acyl-carrier-protein] dehydratase